VIHGIDASLEVEVGTDEASCARVEQTAAHQSRKNRIS
jgi:hypothetical protein